jgi:DNA-binding IclR family transcriptional regulator
MIMYSGSMRTEEYVTVAGRVGELAPLYCTAHGKTLLPDADE